MNSIVSHARKMATNHFDSQRILEETQKYLKRWGAILFLFPPLVTQHFLFHILEDAFQLIKFKLYSGIIFPTVSATIVLWSVPAQLPVDSPQYLLLELTSCLLPSYSGPLVTYRSSSCLLRGAVIQYSIVASFLKTSQHKAMASKV